MNALSLPDLANDDLLATNAGRLANRSRIVDAITRALHAASASVWIAKLQDAGVPCGMVRTVQEAVRHSGGSPKTGVPPMPPAEVRMHPPMLDEHGAQVRKLGWNVFNR
jgi:crotonobetainyl-CoA:carnitine CoA-transferase CaiB-like acyl-CoA transferase